MRFVRISTRVQLAAAALVVALLGGWGLATGAMLWSQAHVSIERAQLAEQRAAVIDRQATVDAYKGSVSDSVRDIEARQKAMEEIFKANLGDVPTSADHLNENRDVKPGKRSGKVSEASPEKAQLQALRSQQAEFESRVAGAAKARLARIEQAIRSFGLNPAAFGSAREGMGGPYVPVRGLIASDPELRELANLLGRLSAMEATLATIPSGRPTAAPMETSSYGYRRDPFNGSMAFHAGIDFPGSYGQPIIAASSGRVSFVGQRPGYGNVIEIDHGNGIMTRYAHLSRFGARVGEKVARGQSIARMGSTGRSTGTHLHFEVRVRGAAVNPRRFLEARQDVLEIQQIAKQRLVRGDRG
ncbi:MAG: M23 family metallopeptidase [Sphingobium sp.]|nr:M23 family metallopeptidase [Sphingobium sp.]